MAASDIIDSEIARLQEELGHWLAIKRLQGRSGVLPHQVVPAKERKVRGQRGQGPTAVILEVLGATPEGMTVAQIRDELLNRGLLKNVSDPHKSTRAALTQLQDTGRVIQNDGHVWRLRVEYFEPK